MILATLVFIGLVAAIVTAARLNVAVERARARFRVLVGGYGDAGMLVEARRRFRQRQQSVESALDTGTVGVQAAHRRLAGLFGRDRDQAAGLYDRMRAVNRGVGRTMAGLLAPKPKKHSESLADWRRSNEPQDSDDL